jgi:SPP1 gp7 family putative phage head morphogenesis protein
MTVHVPEARIRPARLNERLAAAFHYRAAALLAASDRAGRDAAAAYRRIASEAAEEAARGGRMALDRMASSLDRRMGSARRQTAAALAALVRLGRKTAAAAISKALPHEWIAILLARLARTASRESRQPDLVETHGSPDTWSPEVSFIDLWADFREPNRDPSLSPEQAKAMIDAMLFPPPSAEEVERALVEPGPGGIAWEQRLRRWEEPVRRAMLNELSQGLSGGENVDQLRRRLQPWADGLAWKAQRIARTEGRRVMERDYQDRLGALGDLLDGQQIVAVMDEWTRPEHASRNGKIYRRGQDGVFRDAAGNPLPDLPDAPNCRCTTIPVFRPPEEFRGQPEAMAAFETASGRLIPDPASYMDWWERASDKEQILAVGARRYQLVARRLGVQRPDWIEFLDRDGRLIDMATLRREDAEARRRRLSEIEAILTQRRMAFRQVAATGWRATLRQTPSLLRGIWSGEPGSVERLYQAIVAKAEAIFAPDARESQRRRKFQSEVRRGDKVREEMARRLVYHGKAAYRLEGFRRQVRDSELPEFRRRQLLGELDDIERRASRRETEECLFLPEPHRCRLEIRRDASLAADQEGHLDKAVEFVQRITSRKLVNNTTCGEVTVATNPQLKRSFYWNQKIELDPNAKDALCVHELIHHVETALKPEDRESVQKFFAAKTRGADPVALGPPYEPDEKYLPTTSGKPWPNPYMGKIRPGTMEGGELLTMAAQLVYENPGIFAAKYPDLFDLVINTLGKR